MDLQVILAVDDDGKFLSYIPKEEGHRGRGKRHLAIAVLLENSKAEVLLQKRKHKIFDNIWDLTGATHPLHKTDGKDETLEEASLRCLKDEWGISPTSPRLRGVKEEGEFNYFRKDGANCENEHCHLIVGKYDGEVMLSPDSGYEYKWMGKSQFLKDIKEDPGKYTPWAIEGAKLILRRLT